MLTASQFTLKTHHLVVKIKHVLEKDLELRSHVEAGSSSLPSLIQTSGDYVFGTLDTWLLWKLTGGKKHMTDLTNASSTGWWDPYAMRSVQQSFIIDSLVGERLCPTSSAPLQENISHQNLCSHQLKIPLLSLEFVMNPSLDIHFQLMVKMSAASMTHPIALVADQPASLFAQGCWEKGDAKITLGTGGFVQVNTGHKCLAATGAEPISLWRIGNELRFGLEATHHDVGPCIDWIVRNKFAGVDSYQSLNAVSPSLSKKLKN